ncbi:MAG: carboxypeptidase regulatory-like domain-containing protein, partial [Candidatus Sulfotelmatobacter sp.]
MLSTRSCLAATLLVSVVLAVILIVTTTAWGVGIDVTTSMGQGSAKNTVSASAFSTSSGNELLLAFISADSTASPNATVTQVAGGGLTWVLVERANVQSDTAEIWRAFAPSALSGVTGGVHFLRRRGSHWSIQGNISPSSSGTGATVTLTQGSTTVATTTVGAAGSYFFSGVVNGTYTVTPSNAGYVFAPSSQSVTVNGASITGVNFTASLPTGSIQGNISPSSSSTGATVTLTQGSTTIAATTVDSNGNYSLNGVVNGTYTVTPTKSGYACTPLSQSVTVNGAPVTGINFTASALPTYSISGMISPSANGSGAIVTLSGTASATTTADTSGAFSFSGLANGSYTVTPTTAMFTISPASQSVSVNNAPVTGVNFTAAVGLAIDVVTYGDSNSPSTTAVTSTFSTAASNELLLAFISADSIASPNTTVTQVAGGGLTWVLVERVNVQLGTAEIWRAFAPSALSGVTVTATLSQKVDSSITVMSFSGVNTSGTNGSGAIGAVGSGNADPGAPTATLVTTANGSLVLGVGNDWDNGIARTLGTNQAMVHQFLANVGDTYWVQRESNATSLSGTSVTLNDSAPTGDRYNLTIVEVLPAAAGTVGTYGTYGIFGTLSPSAQGSGATVTLSGTASGTTTADGSGNYGFSGLSNGSYTVTPSKSGYSFSPTAQSATINGANVAVNFTVSSSPPPVAVSISPTSATLSTGGRQQFTAYVSGTSNTAVTWSATGGTVTTSGLYTAPGTASTYTVTATSTADTTKSASASVTASQASQVSVSVSPAAVSMNQGAQQQFTATVVGTSNTGVNWSLISGSGTVSSSGLFTAPNKQESDTVQAQSQADTTKTATATVTVPAVGITLSPLSATVQPSGTQQFTATVTGTTNTGVSWSEVGGGSVTQAGLYTAPATSETDTVTATVMASSAATKSASVTVANQSQSGCGATLNWTNSVCQQINGTLKPQWTVVSRHGEYAQGESECNVPWEVFAGNGELRIQT